jgi:lipid II:glycine glycyltransferase (peptidoglycan interpeptide bridge formation enzyme)
LSDRDLLGPWENDNSVVGLLTKSTWSLGLIAFWCKKKLNSNDVVLFVPDYFCDSALRIVRAFGCKLFFYKVDEFGATDFNSLRDLISRNKPNMLLMVHYFGSYNSQANQFREICNKNQIWLIEDCAHSVSGGERIGLSGDFVLYSPHKLLPIPFGAVLSVRGNGPCNIDFADAAFFGSPDSWARCIRNSISETNARFEYVRWGQIVWVAKRFVQRIGIARNIFTQYGVSRISKSLDRTFEDPVMPQFSKRMMNVLITKPNPLVKRLLMPGLPSNSYLDQISAIRQTNLHIWDEVISVISNGRVTFEQISSSSIPYLAAYCGNEEDIEIVYNNLAKIGLPVSMWPDLAEEVKGNSHEHHRAIQLKNRKLFLPLHHSVKFRDIEQLLERYRLKNQIICTVQTEELANQETWESLVKRVALSNLLQSWEYGEAKSFSEGWKVKRLVYLIDGRVVAIAQFLERRIVGVFSVTRLSRGPLFMDKVTDFDQSVVLRDITSDFSIFKRRILSISPETKREDLSMPIAGLTKLNRISPFGTDSAILDLNRDLDDLRKSLDAKWRNQLSSSERAGVVLDYSTSMEDLDWFESIYETLRIEKNFHGIPSLLFQNIARSFRTSRNAHLFIGEYEGRRLAAIFVVTHGTSATYLAGWNGQEGRKLNMNNFLLWNAVKHLKSLGYKKFDLGGIDKINTPSIAQFKLAMNGESYSTIGEFVKLI